MSQVHPLVEGVEVICNGYRTLIDRQGLFERMYEQIRENWNRYREPDRWPSPANWVLRVAPDVTYDPNRRLEKQLQKTVAVCLENEGWGNDVPTASGLVNSRGRGMNVDLGHRIRDGFELVELKLASDSPYDAACQILRYGAIYMLYRLEPELARRFRNEMVRAKHIVLEVLAPHRYYSWADTDLPLLETQLNREVESFAARRAVGASISFRFMAFAPDFVFTPGMDCESIRDAVHHRASPFASAGEPENSLPPDGQRAGAVEIRGHAGQRIRSFSDWEDYALPPDRKLRQWKEDRSEFELGRSWTRNGDPAVPAELVELLESKEGTRRTVVKAGRTQKETPLPFGDRAPRCHDLVLQAERDGSLTTICIEAKADEPFGRTVAEELRAARDRPATRFPERLDWLTRTLLGVPAFENGFDLVPSDVISGLAYQLLTAVAGTLLEAQIQKSTTAIFVVHEFRTSATVDDKLAKNADALEKFLSLFHSQNGGPDENLRLLPGEMVGPISIIGRPAAGLPSLPSEIPLFIGKITGDRRVSAPPAVAGSRKMRLLPVKVYGKYGGRT